MPPDMAISMRHSKITAKEAALLSGEISKPSWESRNEGIHERVSFEDTIWGFDLAGGLFYNTPLRVTFVKPDSRADKAGIRPGDKLKRINDIDTATLTIQEAHDIILESGVHIKLAVTAPEDEEDSYNCYEDPTDTGYDSEEERRKEEEKARKRQVHARVSSYWSLQWPWVSKRRIIYRESNCYMVPSSFEEKHRDKFPIQPRLRTEDDIVLHSTNLDKENQNLKEDDEHNINGDESGIYQEQFVAKPKNLGPNISNTEESETLAQSDTLKVNSNENGVTEKSSLKPQIPSVNGELDSEIDNDTKTHATEVKSLNRSLTEVPEVEEEINIDNEVQSLVNSNENTRENEEKSDVDAKEEIKNNEVIDEILNETQRIQEAEENNIFNDIVSNETNDEHIVDEIKEDGKDTNFNDTVKNEDANENANETFDENTVSEIEEESIMDASEVGDVSEVTEETSELLDER